MQLCAAAWAAVIANAAAASARTSFPCVSIIVVLPPSLRGTVAGAPPPVLTVCGRISEGFMPLRRAAVEWLRGSRGGPAMDAAAPALSIFSFGRAELDEQRRELRVDGRAVPLETKPYELLRVFLRHPGETLSKDELIEAVWPGRVVTEGVLAKCVTKLRGALGDDEQQVVRTLHGYGYRFIAQLTTRPATGVVPIPEPRAGDALPARPHWHLVRELGAGGFGTVWL